MPAPPLESEPAMVTAMAVTTRPVPLAESLSPRKNGKRERTACGSRSLQNPPTERAIDDPAKLTRRDLGIVRHRQRGNDRDAVGARFDHRRCVAGIDPRNANN